MRIVFTSQRFNELLTTTELNQEAKASLACPLMQKFPPLRVRLAYDCRGLEVRLNPAEGRIQENRLKGPGPAFADGDCFPSSVKARSTGCLVPDPVAQQSAQVLNLQLADRLTISFFGA